MNNLYESSEAFTSINRSRWNDEFDNLEYDSLKAKIDLLPTLQIKFKPKLHKTQIRITLIQKKNNEDQQPKKQRSQTYISKTQKQQLDDSSLQSQEQSFSDSESEVAVEQEINQDESKIKGNILTKYRNSFFNEKIKYFNEVKQTQIQSISQAPVSSNGEDPPQIESFQSNLKKGSLIFNKAKFADNQVASTQLQQLQLRIASKPDQLINNQSSMMSSQLLNVQDNSSRNQLSLSDYSSKVNPNLTKQVTLLGQRMQQDISSGVGFYKFPISSSKIQFQDNLTPPIQRDGDDSLSPNRQKSRTHHDVINQVMNMSAQLGSSSQQARFSNNNCPLGAGSNYTIDVPAPNDLESATSLSAQIRINKKSDEDVQQMIIQMIFQKNTQGLQQLLMMVMREYRNEILNLKDYRGNTCLFLAVKLSYKSSDYFEIIKLLLIHGADPSIKDQCGWSPIEESVAQMDLLSTSLLFDYLVSNKERQLLRERVSVDQQLMEK